MSNATTEETITSDEQDKLYALARKEGGYTAAGFNELLVDFGYPNADMKNITRGDFDDLLALAANEDLAEMMNQATGDSCYYNLPKSRRSSS